MIDRKADVALVRAALRRSRVVALLEPRQCGKQTLARQFVSPDSLNYFDLEEPQSLARLTEPDTALRPLKKLVVIDEIQRRPDLFPLLRVLADRTPLPLHGFSFSAARRQTCSGSPPKASRADSKPFPWKAFGFPILAQLAKAATGCAAAFHWLTRRALKPIHGPGGGNFCRLFSNATCLNWALGLRRVVLRRFWNMVAHYHGQIWNAAELARALAVNESTVRRYLDLMTGVFMVRQLPSWFENLGKRQVKAPKIYVRDSGLLHTLLGVTSQHDLEHHPKVGASWEGYAVEEVLKTLQPDEAYY